MTADKTTAPERIWTWSWPQYVGLGQWSCRESGGAVEYIRADLITAQSEENRRLREALEPFAEVAEHDLGEDEADCDAFRPMFGVNRAPYLTVGDLRRARAALSSGEGE